ncbi:Multiple C2 and transmembrane domain-containing protein 1 [Merluccius polli]|uniref:Multiple C2 and transmembrane domain-containing protein 1 n=1 Tax=Merluccius polli TaxID=89951 RepID=A0AA47NZZ5_MERPO|nr:Multiple C2 and transmembrane domain-containing protein 1 [Merluccius polli]
MITNERSFWMATASVNFFASGLFSDMGINIVGPSNVEPPARPPCPAMFQLDILLKKGNNLAIRDRTGEALPAEWITDFLSDRKQHVKLGKHVSDAISTGSPQGCVLSPLLFSLYTNSCTSSHQFVKLLKFADDTTLIGLISDGDESAYRWEADHLVTWCHRNNLELNALQTVEMVVDFKKNSASPAPITLCDSTIDTVESFHFLGIIISQDLKWELNISSLIKKAQQRMYFLRQLKKFNLPRTMMIHFYSSIIESILTSSITIWYAAATAKNKGRLQRVIRDPYVKFKIGGKEVFKSKTIYKNLNPVWDERVSLLVETLREPLYVKVFDYDFGFQDDFMGAAQVHLESLEHQRTLDLSLDLGDPHHPDQNLGTIDLGITLTTKEGDIRETNQSMRLSDVHKKSQLWRGIVSIGLIEGRNLKAMDNNGQSDPYVRFRMGHQKFKSKVFPKSLNPQWKEKFDFHLYDEQGGYIDITVWDRDAGRRDDFMGRCTIDLSTLAREQTHKLDLPLEDGAGVVVLLVTLTASAAVSISDLSVNALDNPYERRQIAQRYGLLKSFHNLKDVGMVQVKVIKAEGLMAADVTGKSDPFCVVELSNDRLQTQTVYKNLSPEWNKVFTFNVKDIHSVLEVTVYDEDRDRSADFLGKVAIPLLNIQNGVRKAYALKSKELTGPTKGVIFLEIDVIFNAIKASIRTINPTEQKYIEEESKMSKQLLLQNFNRVKRCIMFIINVGCFINSCFQWESPQRSICAFVVSELYTPARPPRPPPPKKKQKTKLSNNNKNKQKHLKAFT